MEQEQQGPSTLYARLAAAQADMANPAFDKENPHFRNKFASLAAIRNAIIPTLAKHGLACVQVVEGGRVVTRVYGPDGDRIDLAGVPVTLGGTPQSNGSELTYAKRYSLSAAFCVVGDDDDDGEAATQHWQQQQQQRPQQAPQPPAGQPRPTITQAQAQEGAGIVARLERECGWSRERARAALFAEVGNPPRDAASFAGWAVRARAAADGLANGNRPGAVAAHEAAQEAGGVE